MMLIETMDWALGTGRVTKRFSLGCVRLGYGSGRVGSWRFDPYPSLSSI